MTQSGKSLRTAAAGARYLGSARLGAQEAWLMRVTSAALVPLSIGFVWLSLSLLNKDYNGVRAELGHPLPAILIALFALVACFHMHLGMRSVILDYVHGRAREWALIASACYAGGLALACVYAVLRIGFV
ncbi:MAG: succinate dehydrogenase, hydrophobic membrane anchor protein [Bradyrhizobium sp.]|nr:MAG: succinate dehydrogenase, hydrophobic membrane anchor protein [Bradyrhizobium sp.]